MKYRSTRDKQFVRPLKEVVFRGVPDTGGLYMPEYIPVLEGFDWNKLREMSFQEMALMISKEYFGDELDGAELEQVVNKAFNFPLELVEIGEGIWVLELFHGPTLAFKDFGARFMAGITAEFLKQSDEEITILVATSGDTGSAVGNAFRNIEGVKVVILYPKGRISEVQERQITTLGKNVRALQIEGTFDDCQKLVKSSFADSELSEKLNLTPANSINVCRLLPQSFYYFYAFSRFPDANEFVVSVPSGNLGNLCGGLLAAEMGLPVDKFISSLNRNDVFKNYLDTSEYVPRAAVPTVSNAMDVGNPSNFERIQDLFDSDHKAITSSIEAYSFGDDEIMEAMNEIYNQYGYAMCPHTAAGYLGLCRSGAQGGVFLSTAHAAKFGDVFTDATGEQVAIPEELQQTYSRPVIREEITGDLDSLKQLLLDS